LPRTPFDPLNTRILAPIGVLIAAMLWPFVATSPRIALRPSPTPSAAPVAQEAPLPRVTPRPRSTALESSQVPEPSPSPSSAPSAVPYTPWIPGLESTSFTRGLEQQGFRCAPPSLDARGMTWACRSSSTEMEYVILLHGDGTESVRSIRASAAFVSGSNDMLAAIFLGSVAALTYRGAEPERARSWVMSHISSGGEMTLGAIRFDVSGGLQNRTLDVTVVRPGAP
jgi:hypothetical protein